MSNEDLELLAESLSGLGFYIEAVEQQRPDRERLIAPLLAKRLGEALALAPVDTGDTVEAAVEEMRAALPALVADVREAPADAGARTQLRAKLEDLKNDAELIGDAELTAQAAAALTEFEAGGTAALAAAVTAIAESANAEPAPAISEETQRLLATDATEFDAELLDIYLVEAEEVLDTIRTQRAILDENPGDREALRTARRQFHTLKGSGRMVGLTDLGEIAFEVEMIHNRLLEEERIVTPAVLAMIAEAERSFRAWVGELSTSRRVSVDAAALRAAIAAVEDEMSPSPGAMAPPAPASAKPGLREVPPLLPDIEPETAVEMPSVAAHEFVAPESPAPASPPPLPMPLLELPEVGALEPAAPSVPELAVVPPAPIAAMPIDEITLEAMLPDESGSEAPADEVVVGDVTLSTVLFSILVEEAAQHVATLTHELEVLQFDSRQGPSAAMVRASHTLCGIHRTGGFPLIAATAKSLEQALLVLQQREPLCPGPRCPCSRAPSRGCARSSRASAIAPVSPRRTRPRRRRSRTSSTGCARSRRPLPADADAESQAEVEAARDEHDEARARGPVAVASARRWRADTRARRRGRAAPARARRAGAAEPEPEIDLSPPDDPLVDIHDEVDQDVLPIFLEEAAELFPQTGEQLRAWRKRPGDTTSSSQLRRTLHTFKGSARMAGAMRLGELTHRMESRLDKDGAPAAGDAGAARRARRRSRPHRLRAGGAARRQSQRRAAVGRRDAAASTPDGGGSGACARGSAVPAAKPIVVPLPPVVAGSRPMPAAVTPSAVAAPVAAAPAELETGQRAQLRVRADMIDRLVNEAGEVAIARARVEGELRSLKANLLELTGSVIRLRAQVREIEIQGESQIQSRMSRGRRSRPRGSIRSSSTVTRASRSSRARSPKASTTSRRCSSRCSRTWTTPTRRSSRRRACRATCSSSSSRSALCRSAACRSGCTGSCARRRRSSTSARTSRSAAARPSSTARCWKSSSGRSSTCCATRSTMALESRAARAAAGKPETGEIAIAVRQVGNEIAIELTDDGGGLNLADIRAKAIAQGRIAPDAQPTDAQLIECIFQPGFTTASKVTQVSGRGIGMDVVRAEIAALGGRVEVTTRAGTGTSFLLYLPAHARRRAGGARAGRWPPVGAAGADGRAGAAGQGRGARQSVRRAQGRMAGTGAIRSITCRASWAISTTIPRRRATTPCCSCAPARTSPPSTSTR